MASSGDRRPVDRVCRSVGQSEAATRRDGRTPYTENGGRFLQLDNLSRYPRSDFFDSSAHLNERAQIAHSRQVAAALSAMITGDQLVAKANSAGSLVVP